MPIVPSNGQTPQPAQQAQPQPQHQPQQSAPSPIQQQSRVPQTAGARGPAPRASQNGGGDLSWTDRGAAGAEKAQQEIARVEQRKAEARERGFWPVRFRVKNTIGENQADIIILDSELGPRYYEHMVRNPKTGFEDIPEPCCREFDNCPLCPPSGDKEPYYVMLLTVLDLRGYWSRKLSKHVPVSKNLLAVKTTQQPYFDRLIQRHGSLRGVQLLMTRDGGQYSSSIGTPEFIAKHSDADLEAYVKGQGMWVPKTDKDGKPVSGPDYMIQPFDYSQFLHRPDAERLRRLYGGNAPMGSGQWNGGGQDGGQWGQPQYNPGQAAAPAQATGPADNAASYAPATAPAETAAQPQHQPAPTGGGIQPSAQNTGGGGGYELDDDIPF